jgi:molecular chaperone GrpE
MQEKSKASEEAQGAESAPFNDEIRVKDRRRFSPDGEAASGAQQQQEEEAAPSDASASKATYVEQLEARAQEAERKVADVQSRFEQLRAALQRETDETRTRLNRSAEERARREKADFVTALLPVKDNLQRAIEAAEQGGGLESLLDGVRGTYSNFESALAALGVEPIASVGAQFDPELHEAVDTLQVEPERDGVVTAEYSRGYRMGDRLLRPARVQVGRAQGEVKNAAE